MEKIPQHVAIIMDGNGRWAQARGQSRIMGHHAGVKMVHSVVAASLEQNIQVLTLFAFSSENWRRPKHEINLLLDLFLVVLQREMNKIYENNIRLRVIGDITAFSEKLQQHIKEIEEKTATNDGLLLQVAANYGGRWDITQATRMLARQVEQGKLSVDAIDEQKITDFSVLTGLPDVDFLIRTGGELRISNFLLWHCAYAEFYFTPVLWPDFDANAFQEALKDFACRQRRFGQTGEQIQVA